MKKVSIIILNFNGGRDILDCLNSLMNSDFSGINSNIVVVDNGSTDGSPKAIKEFAERHSYQFVSGTKSLSRKKADRVPPIRINSPKPTIRLIENRTNLGFAAGMNVGIRDALKNGAEAVLLLNQDTVVEREFLRPLVENPADIVAPVIKFKRGGEWVYDFGGRINWWLGRPRHMELSHLLANSFTSEEVDSATTIRGVSLASRDTKIDYVSGCAMLIKRPVFEKIGLLDEKFFLYFEDIDFCLRARKAGFKIAVEPKSVIIHKLSEKKKKPLKQHFSHLKSNLIFVNRYVPLYRRPIAYVYLVLLLFRVLWNHFRSPRRSPFGHLRGVLGCLCLLVAFVI